jgi:SAM-dependent methyltransferase
VTIRSESIQILRHLAGKPGHDEVKADFRQLLIEEFGVDIAEIRFEQRVEVKSRIDALIGRTVFEAKRDLTAEMRDVERKMPDYLANREAETGESFVGIASDGRKWIVFALESGGLLRIKETTLDPEKPVEFIAWLDGALALKISLPPDPTTVRIELGADSVAFRTADQALQRLWLRLKPRPAIQLKRQLWSQLLKIVYGHEVEDDVLWLQHTYLVIVAKCIAFAVLGLNEDEPARLLSGEALASAGINGAVESDFFDWIVADPEGVKLVRRVMAHVRRFRLGEVENDVMKTLYESLIDRDQRHGLGEYYTPDWLAAKMTRHAISAPLEQRVLDPACGSGAFLFHALRRFLEEAAEGDVAPARRAFEATQHIAGVDIHPVAVIIARVTYLLGLAPTLSQRGGAISLPVYLGDSLQLSISEMIGGKELTIRVPPPAAGDGKSGEKDANGREQLDFPDTFCRDPGLFDKAIERMRSGSEQRLTRPQIEAALYRITEQHYRADVTEEQQRAIEDLGKTYLTLDKLRREGRDSIWAYVARNLSRPLAYSAGGGWANVLIGNPPWVAFRHMSEDLQKRFKELAKGARVFVGGKLATQNDLCALFTARAAALFLRGSGRIAFVLPLAVLSRGQFERLRSGSYEDGAISWDETWTMDDSVQPLFPVPACAVFGRRRATPRAMPDTVRAYSGALPLRDCPEATFDGLVAAGKFHVIDNVPKPTEAVFVGGSVYRSLFRDGASMYPRLFWFVERKSLGRIGPNPAAPLVVSRRSVQEKEPWKSAKSIENQVEAPFLRMALLGESILPYRVFRPFEAVVPVAEKGEILDAQAALELGFDHLSGWMRKSQSVWDLHNENADMSLLGRLNYHNELGAQFLERKIRVVYAKAGSQPACCMVQDSSFTIDHMLYWCPTETVNEARFLTAILNSETARGRAAAFQARGQYGARHFDKVMFNLPIPRFDATKKLHRDLAAAAEEAEKVAAAVALPEAMKFQRARAQVRSALTEAGIAKRIDVLVAKLLDSV